MPPKKPALIPVPDQIGHTDHDNYYLCKCAQASPAAQSSLFVRLIDDLCNLLLK